MKKLYLRVYSGIAILFVVLIHANAYYMNHILKNEQDIVMKLFTNIINIAVPMFIFIAGYKYEMTRDSRKIKLYYKNKIKKIIMPTLIISVLWIMFLLGTSILKKLIIGEYVDFYEYIRIFILRIFQIIIGKNDIYQLWYIPMYISITFLFPIIYKYRIIIFVMTSVLQVIGSMLYRRHY